jgi:hypothetical protein
MFPIDRFRESTLSSESPAEWAMFLIDRRQIGWLLTVDHDHVIIDVPDRIVRGRCLRSTIVRWMFPTMID